LLVLSSQLNHYQEGDGLSYCFATLLLEFTPSYWTLLTLSLGIGKGQFKYSKSAVVSDCT
ncbi:MAG: hypothetical protein ACOYEM_09945, partial [Bacillota bacterium]